MNARPKLFAALVILGAIVSSLVLYYADTPVVAEQLGAVVLLSVLALVAEALALVMPQSVTGSIAFIPYLSAVLIAPNWMAVAGAVSVKAIIELLSQRPVVIRLFNISQQAITCAVTVVAFQLTGGQSMIGLEHLGLLDATLAIGLPCVVAFVVSFAVNSTLVFGYIAAKSDKSFVELWKAAYKSTIGLDVIATPIVFLFAWVFVNYGAFAAAAIWVPILGLRQLHKNNLDLERNNSELLELMVKSMEARDPYTSGHSRRVQQFSVAIAKGMGLAPAEIEKVSRAALLHDVGKIHEKYAPILRKPGRLSPDEWQTMQQHPTDGAELISTMSRLHDVVPCVKHHHERWDGTGYPLGLAGETIPMISRVIAFADTIDAMISERPYRRTMSEAEVRAEIVRCRGTQFDPAMTDKILSAPVWRLLFAPEPQSVVARSGLTLLGSEASDVARQA
jgi:putative nucleotidyltransferase with HDIG domain